MHRSYFDHNATTPVSQEVLDQYLPVLLDAYANPSSIHQDGQRARQAMEQARRQLAALLGCDSKEIVWLSGGTEADNLAIFGSQPSHVVTTTIAHPAVLNTCAQLAHAVTYVPVGPTGVVDPDDVRKPIRPNTTLLSVMHVNNE